MALAMYAADSGMAVSCFCDVGNTVDISLADCSGASRRRSGHGRDRPICRIGARPAVIHPGTFGGHRGQAVVVCPLARTPSGQAASLAMSASRQTARACRTIFPPGRSWCIRTRSAPCGPPRPALAGPPVARQAPRHRHRHRRHRHEIADLAEEQGMVVPRFSARLTAAISRHLPAYAASATIPSTSRRYGATIRASIRW